MSRRTLSGQRKKPIPVAGDGRVGDVQLACGHLAAGEPAVHQPSTRRSFWFCPDGCGLQGRRA